jgi:ADP-ribose pyrophosphatase
MNVIEQKVVFDGRKLRVRVDRAVEPSGHEVTRELVVHPGAVAIVARPSSETVLLIRQFRYAAGRELIEIPAGTLEPNEDPVACAARELEEETGYRAARMIHRGTFYTTPGFTTELMYLYEASHLEKTATNPDEDEVIETEIVPAPTALQMVRDGRVQDAKTMVGLMLVLGG